jgi:hypothetical protein
MQRDEPMRQRINETIAHVLDSDDWNRLRFEYLGAQADSR